MDKLKKGFYEYCEAKLSSYGFKRKRNVFFRVVNDVLQVVALKKYCSGDACTVEFGLVPLCMKLDQWFLMVGISPYNLRRFEVVSWSQWDNWIYNPKSNESVEQCIDSIKISIQKYLIPFFDRANCCKTAQIEIEKLLDIFEKNRVTSLLACGISPCTSLAPPEYSFAENMYYIELKNKDYSAALKNRRTLRDINSSALETNRRAGIPDHMLSNQMQKISLLDETIQKLEANDEPYFQSLISENETYMNTILKP